MTDTGVDLVIRIKNGYMSKKSHIEGLYSKTNVSVLAILKKAGYIADYQVVDENKKQMIRIELLYIHGEPSITDVNVVSTPGQRVYVGLKHIKPVLGGSGLSILSTPKGVITGKQARAQKTGGELLFEVW